jgi:hypothetical protein
VQVEGITWHALTLKGDAFDETKRSVNDALGLTPMFEQPGVSVFSMPNGTILEPHTRLKVFRHTDTTTASHSVAVSTTSRRHLRSWPRPDTSCWARDHPS